MKKLFYLTALLILAISCSNDDAPKKPGLNIDETAIIAPEAKSKSVIFDDLTSFQDSINAIFEVDMFCITFERFGHISSGGMLGDNEIDRVNKRFTLRNLFVVYQPHPDEPYILGKLPDMSELIFTRLYSQNGHDYYDTVAYVPTKVLQEVGLKVKAAFDKEDYEECRRLLQTEYIYKPIDAKGYEKLKAAGLN